MKPKSLDNQPDFKNVKINSEDPKDYSWQERRAEIYQIIKKKGYPDLNRTNLSKRYGVSIKQISDDISILKKYVAENNDLEEFVSAGKLNWKKGMEEYVKKGDYLKADKLWNSWKEFLYEEGIREKAPDRQEIKLENDLGNAFSRAEQYLEKQQIEKEEDEEER